MCLFSSIFCLFLSRMKAATCLFVAACLSVAVVKGETRGLLQSFYKYDVCRKDFLNIAVRKNLNIHTSLSFRVVQFLLTQLTVAPSLSVQQITLHFPLLNPFILNKSLFFRPLETRKAQLAGSSHEQKTLQNATKPLQLKSPVAHFRFMVPETKY